MIEFTTSMRVYEATDYCVSNLKKKKALGFSPRTSINSLRGSRTHNQPLSKGTLYPLSYQGISAYLTLLAVIIAQRHKATQTNSYSAYHHLTSNRSGEALVSELTTLVVI